MNTSYNETIKSKGGCDEHSWNVFEDLTSTAADLEGLHVF